MKWFVFVSFCVLIVRAQVVVENCKLSRGSLNELSTLDPMVKIKYVTGFFIDSFELQIPNTWSIKTEDWSTGREANTCFNFFDSNGVEMFHYWENDGSVYVQNEAYHALAEFKHRNDADFDRLLFVHVVKNLEKIRQNDWLDIVDYWTLRVPEGLIVDHIGSHFIVRNQSKAKLLDEFVADYNCEYSSFVFLKDVL